MQYLLTEQEYQDLKNASNIVVHKRERLTQKFCTLVADTMPIKTWLNDGEPIPWGCILTNKHEWYCDECPAKEFCPHPNKHWSK